MPQEELSGRPVQESVTVAGDPFSELTNACEGTTETMAVPDWPGVRVFAGVVAVKFETPTINSHWELRVTLTGDEVEAPSAVVPLKTAVRMWLPSARESVGVAVPAELRAAEAS
jgi:hypothetical protein